MNEGMTAKLKIQKDEKPKMRNSKPRSNVSTVQGFQVGIKTVNSIAFLRANTFLRDTGRQYKTALIRMRRHPADTSQVEVLMDLDMFSMKKEDKTALSKYLKLLGMG